MQMSMHMSVHMSMRMSMHMSMHIAIFNALQCTHLTAYALLAHLDCALLSVCTVTCQQHCITLDDTGSLLQYMTWAARYNTWLLIQLTPKGIVFSFLSTINLSIHMAADFTALTAALHCNIVDSLAWKGIGCAHSITRQPALTGSHQHLLPF